MCVKVVKILHCSIILSLLTGFDEWVHKGSLRGNWINGYKRDSNLTKKNIANEEKKNTSW